MDTWLKAAQKKAAEVQAEVQKRADELQQNASLLAQQTSLLAQSDGHRELTFQDGPLGFELDGAIVMFVAKDSQAAELGVQVGDRLVEVAGYAVPKPRSATDTAGERRARKLVKQWLEEMHRPGTLTFVAPEAVGAPGTEAAELPPETSAAAGDCDFSPLDNSDANVAGSGPEAEQLVDVNAEEKLERARVELQRLRAELKVEKEQVSGLRAELRIAQVAQEQIRGLETELDEARAECQELRHLAVQHDEGVGTSQSRLEVQVRNLQQQLASKRSEHEAMRKQVVDLHAKLAMSSAQCEDLRHALAHNEEVAREASEGRERVLEDEIARIRRELMAKEVENQANSKAAEQMVAGAEERIGDLDAALAQKSKELKELVAQAAAEKDVASRELRRVQEEYAAEHARACDDREQATQALRQQELQALRERDEARREVEELRSAAASTRDERSNQKTEDGRRNEGRPDDLSDPEDELGRAEPCLLLDVPANETSANDAGKDGNNVAEVSALYERITFLEGRCASLQKKLNARPIVCQAYRADPKGSSQENLEGGGKIAAQALPWEPQLRKVLGPEVSAVLVRLYGVGDRTLRRLTERLLGNSMWLWLFYAHLFILYTIASSCSAQTASWSSGSPADALERHMQQGAAATAAAAIGATGHG
mmetsp:Transcript_57781/g.161211  ORF Transcript_57781/g.161211 Transcript_57781/m.161211 type:complete len:656 (-) Transcript_57781:77-2044(-)